METRAYFVIGDLAVNILVGAMVGGLMALMFGPAWNMFAAMIVGMALGMLVSVPLAFVASRLFGAMEVMLPVMTTGMLAGMAVPMVASMAAHTFGDGALMGGVCGLAVFVATYVANAFIKRKASEWTS